MKKVLLRIAMASAAATMLAGCTSPPKINTPSGQPEVVIRGATKKQIADRIAGNALATGAQIKSVNEYAVVIGKRATNDFASQLLYGSRYDGVPEYRVHFGLVDVPNGVRVFSRAEIVTNPGSAFERVTDATPSEATKIQAGLENLANNFRGSSIGPIQDAPSSSATISPQAPVPSRKTAVKQGKDSPSVERLARDQSCNAQPIATLLSKGPGYENYSVACTNGDTLMYRCEFGNCRALK